MLLSNATNHLLDENGLAYPGASEQTDLAALEIGTDQVEHLDARLENLLLRCDVLKQGGLAMDRPARLAELLIGSVERPPPYIENMAEGLIAYRDRDGFAQVADDRSTDHAIGWRHGDRPNLVVA